MKSTASIAGQLGPGQPIVAPERAELRPDGRDRPLPHLVDVHERPALRARIRGRMDVDASRLELGPGATAELVVPERGEEMRLVGEQRKLNRGDTSTATRLLPLLCRVRDLARPGQSLDPREPDPLDVPDDGDLHVPQSHRWAHPDAGGRFRSARVILRRTPVVAETMVPDSNMTTGPERSGRLRTLAVGAGVGLLVGVVVGGTVGRIFMRILFLVNDGNRGFETAMGAIIGDLTSAGTGSIYAFAAFAGVVLGLAYTVGRTLLPSRTGLRTAVFTIGTTAFMLGEIVRE